MVHRSTEFDHRLNVAMGRLLHAHIKFSSFQRYLGYDSPQGTAHLPKRTSPSTSAFTTSAHDTEAITQALSWRQPSISAILSASSNVDLELPSLAPDIQWPSNQALSHVMFVNDKVTPSNDVSVFPINHPSHPILVKSQFEKT